MKREERDRAKIPTNSVQKVIVFYRPAAGNPTVFSENAEVKLSGSGKGAGGR